VIALLGGCSVERRETRDAPQMFANGSRQKFGSKTCFG
jgi:hypothetical protein